MPVVRAVCTKQRSKNATLRLPFSVASASAATTPSAADSVGVAMPR